MEHKMKSILLSGNEAIARGAYEAGVAVGTGYPGTPSTEILENLTRYPGVYTEWSVNEKVGLEVGIGASLAGARTLVTMKHVGLNVAADPLFTASYIGVSGGLVIVNADDPDMHSSQNEQDNRHYARAAKLPMLEPSDSQEALYFTKLGLELSEKYDTPVILRTTTRISHSKSVAMPDTETAASPEKQAARAGKPAGFVRNFKKYVMIPAYARERHKVVEARMQKLSSDADGLEINRMELRDTDFGIITSGINYMYSREAFPQASILKLGMIWPLPHKMIEEFSRKVKRVFVVEELDPFLETEFSSRGIVVTGKKIFPVTGEYSPDLVKQAISKETGKPADMAQSFTSRVALPPRPPALCPGCPHRTVFKILNEMGLTVTGDIGCYTLGVMPPWSAMDTCVEMGGSLGLAQGIEIAGGEEAAKKTVAVIGDSTFAHSGISNLVNAAYNKRRNLFIVLDNNTTAMTGMQPNPFSGERINLCQTISVDYRALGTAVGMKDDQVKIVDAYKPKDVEDALREMLARDELTLLVIKGPCVIWKRKRK
ncbi:MAG: indolepyruvate ferredoxin oxidoreductase subunit alpha [Spirochaetaceae bacterium]|nr:MAG: indolepyruvate ferredoxin oxidoreductase subunit alpha [Spirochaetaceae bacterium]